MNTTKTLVKKGVAKRSVSPRPKLSTYSKKDANSSKKIAFTETDDIREFERSTAKPLEVDQNGPAYDADQALKDSPNEKGILKKKLINNFTESQKSISVKLNLKAQFAREIIFKSREGREDAPL